MFFHPRSKLRGIQPVENKAMKNWAVATKILAKDPKQYQIWRLEQIINYGLDGQKLYRPFLKENLDKLAIDPQKKEYLKFLLRSR